MSTVLLASSRCGYHFYLNFLLDSFFCNFAVDIQTQEASRDEDEAFIASLHSRCNFFLYDGEITHSSSSREMV